MSEKNKTKPEVFIIESLKFDEEEEYREGEAIFRSLRMSLNEPRYHYVRTAKELQHFVDEFEKCKYRYLHISCHGSKSSISTTLDDMKIGEFAEIVGPVLERRRLFLSTCLASTPEMATAIFQHSRCYSMAGPTSKINFDDSVILWTTFYHLMFKANERVMKKESIKRTLAQCAATVGEKIAFYTPRKDGHARVVLPEKGPHSLAWRTAS